MSTAGARSTASFGAIALSLLLAACGGSGDNGGFGGGTTPPPAPSTSLRLQPVTAALTAPVFMTAAPNELARLFVVEQGGLIRILDSLNGVPRATPFLDIRGLITTGGERGLLGMTFDPEYTTNRRFYIFYTNGSGALVVARYPGKRLERGFGRQRFGSHSQDDRPSRIQP